jgi:hypothetical protein
MDLPLYFRRQVLSERQGWRQRERLRQRQRVACTDREWHAQIERACTLSLKIIPTAAAAAYAEAEDIRSSCKEGTLVGLYSFWFATDVILPAQPLGQRSFRLRFRVRVPGRVKSALLAQWIRRNPPKKSKHSFVLANKNVCCFLC